MSTWDDARGAIQDELELGNLCSTHEKEQADAAMRAIQSVGGAVIAKSDWALVSWWLSYDSSCHDPDVGPAIKRIQTDVSSAFTQEPQP